MKLVVALFCLTSFVAGFIVALSVAPRPPASASEAAGGAEAVSNAAVPEVERP